MSKSIPTIASLVGAFKSGEHAAAAALESLRVHYVVPLVKSDGTVDRKGADFAEVRKQAEAALVADFAATTRTVSGIRIEPGSDLHKRIGDLFALSKGVMKKMSKTDADWVVATAVKNAVRRDWNRIVKACLPKTDKADDADDTATPDTAAGSGTKAGDKAAQSVTLTDADILAAVQNFVAAAPDASSAATFLHSVENLIKCLRSDLKAGRKVLPCEA
jgi:hypothetical protein